ncbi:MAG: nucleoside triphosphate pyrophosphatase [Pseudomonadota bacterium]
MRLILASASPRRLELLAQLGLTPDEVAPADVDETPRPGELPRAYCIRVTRAKASVFAAQTGDIVLAADTTVALGRRILGKPADAKEARRFLTQLSGRRHKVITAIVLRKDDQIWQRDVVTTVRMKRLSDREIAGYLSTGDWQGKAGGYAIQGPAGAFASWIQGSYSAVMGLPLAETAHILTAAGYPMWKGSL